MEYGLPRESIKAILEDALRHDENLTKEGIIEAVTTAIDENNKKLRADLTKVSSKQAQGLMKNMKLQVNNH
jgi:hypothetical protein